MLLSAGPLWLTALVFLLASAAIWWAGTRLEHQADRIARRTGLGHSFTGMVLLATATSLPELATTVTAVLVLSNPTLAVHNLLGGVALQTALLAFADAVKPRRGALTFFAPDFSLLLQGVGQLVLLQLAILGIITRGAPALGPVSAWPLLLLLAYLWVLYLAYRHRAQPRWAPAPLGDLPAALRPAPAAEAPEAERGASAAHGGGATGSARRLYLGFAGLALVVLVGGYAATGSAERLAEHAGLSDAFVGATLLALATSLPELSTTFEASRHERYPVAFSNVFGSNCIDVALLVVAELLWWRGSVFGGVEPGAALIPLVASVMTCIYLWGLMERRNGTVLGLGRDSAAALLVYGAGVALLYLSGRA